MTIPCLENGRWSSCTCFTAVSLVESAGGSLEVEPDRSSIDEVSIEMIRVHQYRPREQRKRVSDGPSGVDLRHVKYWCRREGCTIPPGRETPMLIICSACPAWRAFMNGRITIMSMRSSCFESRSNISLINIDLVSLGHLAPPKSLFKEGVNSRTTYSYACRMHAAGSCIHLDWVSDQLAMFLWLVRFSNADRRPRSSPLPLSGACQWLFAPVQE